MTNYTAGIYEILNTVNGKRYIGSSVDVPNRLYEHQRTLQKNEHGNSVLQNAWNKYGEESFTFKPIIWCSKENLLFYEQRAIDGYDSHKNNNGYNICPTAGNHLGRKFTDESKKKISNTLKGRPLSEETKNKMKGRKRPKECVDKLRKRMKELWADPIWRENQRKKRTAPEFVENNKTNAEKWKNSEAGKEFRARQSKKANSRRRHKDGKLI